MNIILIIIFVIITIQLATISHQLGHAIPAIIFSNDKVRVVLGHKRMNKILKINKLSINIRSFQPFTGFVCYNAKNMKKKQVMLICIGGPITSLLIGIISIILNNIVLNDVVSKILIFSSIYNIGLFLVTIVPIIYPNWFGKLGGYSSDGYKAVTRIK